MIITDDFVFINIPKTGSTFVRTALKTVYRHESLQEKLLRLIHVSKKSKICELMLPNVFEEAVLHTRRDDPHGICSRIPAQYRGRTVVAGMRNPYAMLVSLYRYRYWTKNPIYNNDIVHKLFPDFENLDFSGYLRLVYTYLIETYMESQKVKADMGPLTFQFILFCFKNPGQALKAFSEEYITGEYYLRDMEDITFLHAENLNKELYDFLCATGVPAKKAARVLTMDKVNVSRDAASDKPLRSWFSPDEAELVRHKERMLFRLFPEYTLP